MSLRNRSRSQLFEFNGRLFIVTCSRWDGRKDFFSIRCGKSEHFFQYVEISLKIEQIKIFCCSSFSADLYLFFIFFSFYRNPVRPARDILCSPRSLGHEGWIRNSISNPNDDRSSYCEVWIRMRTLSASISFLSRVRDKKWVILARIAGPEGRDSSAADPKRGRENMKAIRRGFAGSAKRASAGGRMGDSPRCVLRISVHCFLYEILWVYTECFRMATWSFLENIYFFVVNSIFYRY